MYVVYYVIPYCNPDPMGFFKTKEEADEYAKKAIEGEKWADEIWGEPFPKATIFVTRAWF